MLAGTVSFVSGNTMRGAAVDVCNKCKTNNDRRKAAASQGGVGTLKGSQGVVGRKGPKYQTVSAKYFLSCLENVNCL